MLGNISFQKFDLFIMTLVDGETIIILGSEKSRENLACMMMLTKMQGIPCFSTF